MAKQAKIKCPHCGKAFTVRQVDEPLLDQMNKEMDGIWKVVDDAFKRIFGK